MELNALTLRHGATLLKIGWKKLVSMLSKRGVESRSTPGPADTEPLIDVRDLIAQASIEELNEKAEAYFSHLSDWDYYLAKPFGNVADGPALLINFATMIQGLELAPGLRVLDFGAGTGWTSRYLTQMGCEVTLLDVSATALEIAAELYRRQPVIGKRPSPAFLLFDGQRIDLPSGSMDRILCFDAFHHAPNPDHILGELARVLAPGGIAAFAEPGPAHSKTPQSQSEMRTYGVIENDIDIRTIWRIAQEVGFVDLKLAAYNVPPFLVSLSRYEDLLRGGEAYLRWAESTRAFLGDVRNFFLRRGGRPKLDSHRTEALSASAEIEVSTPTVAGQPVRIRAVVTNRGGAVWLPSGQPRGGVSLGCHLYDGNGDLLAFDHHWQALTEPPRLIEPGERVVVDFEIPPLAPGRFTLEFDCVADGVAWFGDIGSPTVRCLVDVVAESDASRATDNR